MLNTIAIILIALWLLGIVSAYTLIGYIHIILIVALIMFLSNVVMNRYPPVM